MATIDLVSNLLPGILSAEGRRRQEATQALASQAQAGGESLLGGIPGLTAVAPAASQQKRNLAGLFSGLTGVNVDVRSPIEKINAQLAASGVDMNTSAGLLQAAKLAQAAGLSQQAVQLATLAGTAQKTERETQAKKNTVIGLQNAVINAAGDNQVSRETISQITDTTVLTELYKELNKPSNKDVKTSVQTVVRNGTDTLVLINEETGSEIAVLGTAPSTYASTVKSVDSDGKPVTLVLDNKGNVINKISGVTEGKTQSDIYYEAYQAERQNNPSLTPLQFHTQWEQAGNSNPERANYEYAMQGLEEGDAGWMSFGDWLNRGLLTTDQRNYQQAKSEGYEGNFMTWLAENDKPTLVKEYEAAQKFGWEGTIDQWVELGGSKNINLPSVPTGYQVKTDIDENGNTVYRAEKIGGIGMSALEAGRLALVETGLEAAGYFNDYVFNEDGSVNESNVLAFFGTDKLNVPGPGRTMEALFLEAIEAKLRLETGAAAPEAEVQRLKTRLMPGVFDSDQTIRFKQLMLHRFLNQAYGYIKGTEEGGFDSDGQWIIPGTTPERAAIRSRNIVNKLISEINEYERTGKTPAQLKSIDELRGEFE